MNALAEKRTDNMTNLKPIETSDGRSVQNLLTQLLLLWEIRTEKQSITISILHSWLQHSI
jgi:hypothetical protein